MATTAQSDSVLELYSAYFNRAADADGLIFWKNSFDTFLKSAEGKDDTEKSAFALRKIAEDMTKSSEYQSLYESNLSNKEFVGQIYKNLLNRDAEPEGLAFWSNHITKGTLTKEQAINEMIAGAKANTSDQGKLDAGLIANKNEVSKYFAETLKLNDVPLAKKAFNGGTKDTADDVTSEADSVVAAKATLDKEAVEVTFTKLTAGADLVDGTSGNDTYTSTYGTLQSGDVLTDRSKADSDILNTEMLLYEEKIIPTLRNIETINAKSLGSVVGLNVQNVAATEVLTLDSNPNGRADVDNVASNKVASIVANANIKVLEITSAPSGTTTTPVLITAPSVTSLDILGSGLNKHGTDFSSGTTDAYVLKSLAPNGKVVFSAGGGNDTFVMEDGISAKEFTYHGSDGDDTLLFIGKSSAPTITITGGRGDDNYAVSGPEKTLKSLTMSGGVGEDKITVNLRGTVENSPADLIMPAAGIEELVFNGEIAPTEFKLSANSALNGTNLEILGDQNLTIMGAGNNFHGFNVRDSASVETSISTLKITGATTAPIDLSKAAVDFVDIARINGAGNQILFDKESTIKLSKDLSQPITIAGDAEKSVTIDLAADQAAKITIESGVITTNNNILAYTTNGTLSSATITNTTEDLELKGLDVKGVTTVTLTGDKKMVIADGGYTDISTTIFDASASTGSLSIKSGVKGTITGGTANDKLEVTAVSATAILNGGDGNDTLILSNGSIKAVNGDAGNDTIDLEGTGVTGIDLSVSGGAGSDTYKLDAATINTPSASQYFKLTYGAGDKIVMDNMTLTSVNEKIGSDNKVNAKGIASFDSNTTTLASKLTVLENVMFNATSGTPAVVTQDAGESALFTNAGKGYLFISDSVGGVSSGDTLIELTGISSFSSGLTFNNGDIVSIG